MLEIKTLPVTGDEARCDVLYVRGRNWISWDGRRWRRISGASLSQSLKARLSPTTSGQG